MRLVDAEPADVHGEARPGRGRNPEREPGERPPGVGPEVERFELPARRVPAQVEERHAVEIVGEDQADLERRGAGRGQAIGDVELRRARQIEVGLEEVEVLVGAHVAGDPKRRAAVVGRLEIVRDLDRRAGGLHPPAPRRLEILEREVVPARLGPVRRRAVDAVDEIPVALPRPEVRHKRQRVDGGRGRDVVADPLPPGVRAARVTVCADPEGLLGGPVGVVVGIGGLVGAVDAEREAMRLAFGEEHADAARDAEPTRLVVDAGVEVVRVAPERLGVGAARIELGRGPPEVEEHVVRDADIALLEEGVVLGVELLLPEDAARLRHRVVPLDAEVGLLLHVDHQVLEIGGERGIPARRLLVDEPPLEAVILRYLDELIGDGERVAVALHEVADPLDLAAKGRRGEEDGAEDGDAVAVRGVGDAGVRGKDQPLPCRAAPEHEQVGVGPVAERVIVEAERALRRVAARRRERGEGVDAAFAEADVIVGLKAGHGAARAERDRAPVIRRVGIARRAPVEERVRVPVRRVGLVRGRHRRRAVRGSEASI